MNMKSAEVYIVANGSSIRAFRRRVEDPVLDREPLHLEEIALDPSIKLPTRDDAVASDRPGRFESGGRAGTGNNLVHGERHGVTQEWEKRQGRALADIVEKIVKEQNLKSWSLLAPQKWISLIEAGLSAATAKKLTTSEAVDLTKHTLQDIDKRILA